MAQHLEKAILLHTLGVQVGADEEGLSRVSGSSLRFTVGE